MKPSFLFILRKRLQKKDFLYESFFKNKKTLDVGCGEGEFLQNDSKKILGVESNKRLAGSNPQIILADATNLPFKDGEFEAIHCRNVIEHLGADEAYRMLCESTRVLKSGGLFILASEVVTKKFWGTFGHIKPYPPGAILKLLRGKSREEFDGITNLEHLETFYLGDFYRNKLLYLISAWLGYHFPKLFAREYFMILRKTKM